MYLLSDLDFSLPFKNPVIIFSLVLFIILFAPILLNKIKVPHIIGLIVAGVIVGPYGLNLLSRDSSIVLFGTVGLLYIMFLAGLEIDLTEFKKNRNKILFFGLVTFLFPLILGALASYYLLGYGILSSILLASMFSTHTLVSYPIASRYGVARNRAVTLTIGGTMITDILALLILAAIVGMTKEEVTNTFWIKLGVSSVIFVAIVFFGFPFIIRWFFKQFEDSVSQYIFVLAIVFMSSFLAEVAGIEAIIGAFFSGLVLNKFIPHSSPLMNRIDFVGNALFIPFFLISVGMLVDVSVLVKGFGALKVAGVIVVVAVATKYLAAVLTAKLFNLSKDEGKMIFGLSTSHAAATLAIILVGYNTIIGETGNGEPIRLLSEDVLNGTILLILVSCAISSFVVEKASRNLALQEESGELEEKSTDQKIMISLAYPETVTELVDLGLMLKPKKSDISIYALHIISDETDPDKANATGRKMMEKAVMHAAATESTIIPLTRFDMNISNGIIYSIKEQNITDVLIGLHQHADQKYFLGPTTERILKGTMETLYIYKSAQPFNTLKRMIVVVPPRAEFEPGFVHWNNKLFGIAKEAGLSIVFYAHPATLKELDSQFHRSGRPIKATFIQFSNWDDFLILGREVKQNDLFVIISSRKGHVSYISQLEKLPYFLTSYFDTSSFIILYPKQLEVGLNLEDIEQADSTLLETISDKISVVNRAGSLLKKLLNKKGR
ncbi:cation:proton antiporter [Chitinophagaceae bacterium LB-8]|jgi:Na+:H+ antiporter|uniref:Cation:proton antiporter n=1 Tax=Paraflavisolibacter caeni TaxID=2982496 RepID=A0A9X2XNU1_9BACT|nr:cation:proton antiporter [Paraflavisolibacter caeni]MCU7549104.1 cation:proton antiporter [Paraflavisolibacter caeni]